MATARRSPARLSKPAAEVMSGNGTHLWFPLASSAEVQASTSALNGAMTALGADSMGDPGRIIRLPWTINVPSERKRKAGAELVLATVAQEDGAAPARSVDDLIALWRGGEAAPVTVKPALTVTAPAALRAPGKASVIDALARLPNGDGVDAEFPTRNAEVAVAHAVRGSVLGTDFDDADVREAFIEWAAQFGDDAEHAGALYDGIRSSRTGWPDLRAMLVERVAAVAFEAAPDPAQAEQLKGIPAALEPGVPDWVAEVNRRYAYLESADRILDINPDTGQVDKYLTPEQFKTRLGNQMIASGTRSVGLGQAWLTHPQRRQYAKLGWWPVGTEPKGALNQWRGFPTGTGLADDPEWRPLPINPPNALTPTLNFVSDVIASGRKDVAEYVLDYAAFKVQNPTARPGTALALVGASGTGKTTLGTMIADLFGPQHSRSISKPDQVLGRFNAALEGAMILNLEEAIFGGDKRIRGIYKDMITSPVINIERKGLDIGAPVPNMAAVIITSNEMSAIPHEPGERRTTFLEVSDVHRQDAAYFGALHGNWTSGGREAFLDFLLKRDVSRFNPRQALSTPEKAKAAGENGDTTVQFWAEVLDSGKLPMILNPDGSEPDWNAGPLTVPDSAIFGAFMAFAKDRGAQLRYLETKAALMRRLEELCPGMRATQPRPTPNKPGVRSRAFPPLDECRAAFNTAMGGSG